MQTQGQILAGVPIPRETPGNAGTESPSASCRLQDHHNRAIADSKEFQDSKESWLAFGLFAAQAQQEHPGPTAHTRGPIVKPDIEDSSATEHLLFPSPAHATKTLQGQDGTAQPAPPREQGQGQKKAASTPSGGKPFGQGRKQCPPKIEDSDPEAEAESEPEKSKSEKGKGKSK